MLQTLQQFTLRDTLQLESGDSLENVTIGYHTFGQLNKEKSNVIWVFHALTGNSDPMDWWPGIVGASSAIDPEQHFIVCANMLGSCYGSSGPEDFDYPLITIKDQVTCFRHLKAHLQLDRIKMGIGGSMGGQQLLEWAVQEPSLFEIIVPISTNAIHSPWGIAFNETQRMALKSDPENGIETARAIAMLSYRHYHTYQQTQSDTDERLDHFSASSYQNYQGLKLRKRFNPFSYFVLSKAMDSHHVGSKGITLDSALGGIESKAVIIGIDTDLLFPVHEQKLLADTIPNSAYHEVESLYGHDGFLVEREAISSIIKGILNG